MTPGLTRASSKGLSKVHIVSNCRPTTTICGNWGSEKGSSLPFYIYLALISLAAIWLVGHQIVKRRFAILKIDLAKAYASAIAVPPEDGETPRLIALCVDLIRKEHCTEPFNTLSPYEQKMALHAHAVEKLPRWMSQYASLGLPASGRVLISKLGQVLVSRPPKKPVQYYGAVKRQQQLRSTSKS